MEMWGNDRLGQKRKIDRHRNASKITKKEKKPDGLGWYDTSVRMGQNCYLLLPHGRTCATAGYQTASSSRKADSDGLWTLAGQYSLPWHIHT